MILAAVAALLLLPLAANAQVADVQVGPAAAQFQPQVTHNGGVLTIRTPGGDVLRHEFAAGENPVLNLFDDNGSPLADGIYKWEMVLAPVLDAGAKAAMEAARNAGEELPGRSLVASGSFAIAGGQFASPDLIEAPAVRNDVAGTPGGASPEATVLATNDGVVRFSLCVGGDCPNSPSFGDTTLLLMENNLRLKFDDTSNSGSFPNNDWQLQANDSANGGDSYFGFRDCGVSSQGGCGGNLVFAVEAGAPNNALHVDNGGRVGLGTGTPVVELHIVDGDTPTLRLEQDSSSGFTAQTWDIAGNETNFFVRDVTHGSALSFKIRPDADENSLVIDAGSDIAIGTANAGTLTNGTDAAVHVRRTDGTASVLVEEANGTTTGRIMLELRNNGGAQFSLVNSDSGDEWRNLVNNAGNYAINLAGDADTEMLLDQSGNMTISGTYSPSSDRNRKRDIVPVSSQEILDKVTQLPIAEWSYIADDGIRHIGPMAQDFRAAFGVGPDDKHISTVDADGVALAAIQALHSELQAKNAELDELKARMAELEKRLP
jgi:hypothetical protein